MNSSFTHYMIVLSAVVSLVSCGKKAPQGSSPPSSSGAGRNLVLPPGITSVRVLDQNWNDEAAVRFYNTPQGSQMLPYAWFLNLEKVDSTAPFRDPATFLKYGYLPRTPGSGNPDGLPVGFAKNDTFVGLTCAACHTGILTVKDTAFLIDGAPTMSDANGFMKALVAAMDATLSDEAKFSRFATAVLGNQISDPQKSEGLKADFKRWAANRADYNHRNFPQTSKPGFGPGRIDAFGAIFNEVAVRFAQVPNAETRVNAPVSYPFLWDTPQHNKVQWNGSVTNTELPVGQIFGTRYIGALGRNIGEVLGVFGDVDTTKQEEPFGGYPSSVNKNNLNDLEDLVRELWSPKWPEELGQTDERFAIKEELRAKGEEIYKNPNKGNCIACHALLDRKDKNRKVTAIMAAVNTDETMASNFATRDSSSGIFNGRLLVQAPPDFPPFRDLGPTENVGKLLSHLGERVIIGGKLVRREDIFPLQHEIHVQIGKGDKRVSMTLTNTKVSNEGKLLSGDVKSQSLVESDQKTPISAEANLSALRPEVAHNFKLMSSSTPEGVSQIKNVYTADADSTSSYEYKARPLNGIWATAPYLHNGSVRTLYQLLLPPADRNERKPTFHVGTREFDPEEVGFKDEGDFIFDTSAQPGNSNAGHEYGTHLGDAERRQLLVYLKSL
jgi:hypothetical protein